MLLNQIDLTGYQMIKYYFKITKQFPKFMYMKIAGQNLTYKFFKKSIFFPFQCFEMAVFSEWDY